MAVTRVFMVKEVHRYPKYGTSLGRDIVLQGPQHNADYLKLRLSYDELVNWADFKPGGFVQVTLEEVPQPTQPHQEAVTPL